jgi:hypothetical protein
VTNEPDGARRLLLRTLFGEDAFDRVASPLAETYRKLVPQVWALLVGSQLSAHPELADKVGAPAVEVVHSIATRPLSSFDGDSWYLTYDQHLGQVLSRLTRLVMSEVEPEIADHYLRKLFAQRLFVAGQFTAAWAMSNPRATPKRPPPETVDDFKRRMQLVSAQEAFVIGHELTHILIGQIPQVREELREELFMFLRMNRSTPAAIRRKAFEDDWDNSIRAALQRYGLTPSEAKYEAPWSTGSDVVNTDTLSANTSLLDECICDLAGSIASAMSSALFGGLSLTDAFVASGIALHNLRLLQELDQYARNSTETEDDDSVFQESIVRLAVHRTSIRAFCAAMSHGLPVDERDVQRDMTAFNKTFSAIIQDPVLFVLQFDEFVSYVKGEMQKKSLSESDNSWSPDQRAAVRAQLGFVSDAVRLGVGRNR